MRGEYVYAVKHLAGQPVVDLLPGLLLDILESLSFPKICAGPIMIFGSCVYPLAGSTVR
ncbi:MAG: hypothetical protein ACLRXQ_10640 [Phascolarctobacterium faecium]